MLQISVVIPARNSAETIVRAIESAQAQTLAPDEIVVVDDGSEDDTAKLAKRAGARVIRHGESLGAAASRDDGIRATTSDAVALLDADDTFTLDHLDAAARVLATGHNVSLSFSRAMELRDDGTLRFPVTYPAHLLERPLWAMAWNNLVPTSAAVIPRWSYDASGGFDRSFPGASTEDFDLWLRLALQGPFACTGIVGSVRHVSPSSTSRRAESLERMLHNGLRAVHNAAALTTEPWFLRVATGHIRREAARRFLAAGFVERAREEARHALRCNPADAGAWELWALAKAPAPVVTAARYVNARLHEFRARFTAA